MRYRPAFVIVLSSCLLLASACGGALYKVATLPAPAPVIEESKGLKIGASAFAGEASLNQFEANLPLAGVVAVDVRLANRTNAEVSTDKFKFELRDAEDKALRRLDAKNALNLVMDYYGNTVYTKAAYQKTRDDYEAILLKTKGVLRPQEERRGVLFFRLRHEEQFKDLRLIVKGADKAEMTVKVEAR